MFLVRALRATRLSARTVVPRPQCYPPCSLHSSGSTLLNTLRSYSSSPLSSDAPDSPSAIRRSSEQSSNDTDEPRYSITFTCTVAKCGERTSHMFTKHAYHNGIVIIQCPGCKNRHLIADNLGWFKDERTGEGTQRNIEDIMRAKGESVKRGRLDAGGVVEYSP